MKKRKSTVCVFRSFASYFQNNYFGKHIYMAASLTSLTWSYKLTKNRQSQWPHKFSRNSRNNFSLVDIQNLLFFIMRLDYETFYYEICSYEQRYLCKVNKRIKSSLKFNCLIVGNYTEEWPDFKKPGRLT